MSTETVNQPPVAAPSADSGPERLLRAAVAFAMIGGPVGYLVGGVLEPAAHLSGAATIAANADANSATNTIHMVAFVLASYLLPIGVVGLAFLARVRSPWLATIGGLLGVIGWLPFSALTALDELPRAMVGPPTSPDYGRLYDRFAYGALMNGYLLVYIIGHLAAYVILGIALRRAAVIPTWAAWCMIASSPLLVAAFVLPDGLGRTPLAVAGLSVAILILGTLPAAGAMLRGSAPGGSDPRPQADAGTPLL